MPRRRGPRRRNGATKQAQGPITPQRTSQLIDLTKFQPARRIMVATEATLAAVPLKLPFSASSPPASATELFAISTFRLAFENSRVVSISVCFDQRGSASTAAQPRLLAFCLDKASSLVDESKLTNLASYAGSGINQIVPGRPYNINIGPKFQAGQFSGLINNGTLLLAAQDYNGTVRIHTTFEVLGPPKDLDTDFEAPQSADDI